MLRRLQALGKAATLAHACMPEWRISVRGDAKKSFNLTIENWARYRTRRTDETKMWYYAPEERAWTGKEYYKEVTKDSLSLDIYFRLEKKTNGKYVVTNSDTILELKTFQPIEENRFEGNIGLIDGGTLSAAAMAADQGRGRSPVSFFHV